MNDRGDSSAEEGDVVLSTEARMVVDALADTTLQGVVGLVAGLPDDHVRAAVAELVESWEAAVDRFLAQYDKAVTSS